MSNTSDYLQKQTLNENPIDECGILSTRHDSWDLLNDVTLFVEETFHLTTTIRVWLCVWSSPQRRIDEVDLPLLLIYVWLTGRRLGHSIIYK